jgi:hypothetical protein
MEETDICNFCGHLRRYRAPPFRQLWLTTSFGASFSKWRNSRASSERVLEAKTTASSFTRGPQTLHSTGFRCWIEKVAETEKRPIFKLMVDLVSGARHRLSI